MTHPAVPEQEGRLALDDLEAVMAVAWDGHGCFLLFLSKVYAFLRSEGGGYAKLLQDVTRYMEGCS